jgi:phage tail-like protein
MLEQPRIDPYRNFKFRVKWGGQYGAGIPKMSALKSSTEVIQLREGGNAIAHKSPRRTSFDAITLERGITHDHAFDDWARQVWSASNGQGAGGVAPGFRKDLVIELRKEKGQPVAAYKVHRCWISEYQALPYLDADGNGITIEHIKVENEGWERDDSLIPKVIGEISPDQPIEKTPPVLGN